MLTPLQLERAPDDPLITEIVESILDNFQRSFACQGTSTELLPKLLEIIERIQQIPDKGCSGIEYKADVVKRLCQSKWNKQCIGLFISVLRDISMDQETLEKAVTKITEELSQVDLPDLPPIVHQILVLSSQVTLHIV